MGLPVTPSLVLPKRLISDILDSIGCTIHYDISVQICYGSQIWGSGEDKGFAAVPYYHVRITPKSNPSEIEAVLDLGLKELEERFVETHKQGRPIVINGKTIVASDLDRIEIHETNEPSSEMGLLLRAYEIEIGQASPSDDEWGYSAPTLAQQGSDVTNKYIVEALGQSSESEKETTATESRPPANAREVFVVHGRNDAARAAMFAFLRSIHLIPLEWNVAREDTGKPSPYIGEILQAAFSRAHAVVVLLTPDDEVRLKSEFKIDGDPPHETQLTGQARPNVLFESGMAMGRQPDRVVLVELGNLRPFTDVAGLHIVRMDGSSQRRQELAQKLRTAGCPVNLDGQDWHTDGDFEDALRKTATISEEEQVVDTHELIANELSDDAHELLLSGALDQHGLIYSIAAAKGRMIQANGTVYTTANDPRSVARWEKALKELVSAECIEPSDNKGIAYKLTHKGFALADSLVGELK